uniref:Methyltransferase domain-containing protein n=2 Tax=Clastoptera arizonana TaxID=38151 RepID=A0A1B6D0Q0_9HEMI
MMYSISSSGAILVGLTGGVSVGLMAVCLPFITPALRRVCLPYVPATTTQVKNVLKVLSGRGGNLVDLGSGDGRIVVAAAKVGLAADGVELNPWLVFYSRFAAYKAGVSHSTSFYRKNLFEYSLKPYNNIVIFGVQEMMLELEQKIEKEAGNDTWVVACRFPLPTKQPSQTVDAGIDSVWMYKFNPTISS